MRTGKRIAMWSGPRNISTALMRSWEARGDTAVWDEPLYAFYLQQTGREHPGRDEIIRSYETNPESLASRLCGPPPNGKAIWYQKHMAHHLLRSFPRDWLASASHGFLIRDPREMLPSLARVTKEPTIEDTGLPQQAALFDALRDATGIIPPVIDARDVLQHPDAMLSALCRAFAVPFTRRMLRWSAGPRVSDGIWARYWYSKVEQSTGFEPYRPPSDPLPDHFRPLYEACKPYYDLMYAHRLTPDHAVIG